jgi:hypothetical protein
MRGPGGAVRRLQDERLWPLVRQAASGRVSQRQGGLDQDGLGVRICNIREWRLRLPLPLPFPIANKTNRLHILIDKHVPGRT